jgi:hypothetical protein
LSKLTIHDVLEEVRKNNASVKEDILSISSDIKRIMGAFPDNNPEGHRRGHEVAMEEYARRRKVEEELLAEKKQLRLAIKEKIYPAAVWALLTVLIAWLWKSSQIHIINMWEWVTIGINSWFHK